MTRRFTFRAATFNAFAAHLTDPGGEGYGRFPTASKRASLAVALFLRLTLDAVGCQEVEGRFVAAVKGSRLLGVFRGRPDDTGRWGQVGKAVVWLRARWTIVHAYQLVVPVHSGGHDHGLTFPVVLLRHKLFRRRQVVVISGHHPSQGPRSGGSDADRRMCWAYIAAYVKSCVALGLPVVYCVDTNDHHAEDACELAGLDVAAYGVIDMVAVTPDITVRKARVVSRGTVTRATDHQRLVMASLRIPVQPKPTSPDLPSLKEHAR